MKQHFGHRFRILHCCTDQLMTEAMAQMDLTSSQSRIMGFIARSKAPPCPRDIEEFFGLSHPSVSGTLNRLEKKNFIEFRPDENDHRCKRIYILPKGQECHSRMVQTIDGIESRIVSDFTAEEQAQFSALLNRAIHNLGGDQCHPCKEEPKK